MHSARPASLASLFGLHWLRATLQADMRHAIHPLAAPLAWRQVNGRLRELHTTLEAGDRLREGVLQGMALNLDAWSIQVRVSCCVLQ